MHACGAAGVWCGRRRTYYGSTPYRIYDAPVISPAYVVHIAYLQPQQQQRRAHSADIRTMPPRANYASSGFVPLFPATCLRCFLSLPFLNSLLKIRIPSQQCGTCRTGSSTVAGTCVHRYGQHLSWTVANNSRHQRFFGQLCFRCACPESVC